MGGRRFPFRLGVDGPQLGPTTGPHMVIRSPSLGSSPLHVGLAGSARRHRPPRGRGGPLQFPGQPSGRSTPITPESSWAPAPGSWCRPWPSPNINGLGSLLIRLPAGITDDACAGFAARCRPVSCSPPHRDFVAPLRRQDLARRREPCYRGPWRLPGPDLHWLVVLSLSLGSCYSPPPFGSWRPSHLDALMDIIPESAIEVHSAGARRRTRSRSEIGPATRHLLYDHPLRGGLAGD
jgi:hypothetical protein